MNLIYKFTLIVFITLKTFNLFGQLPDSLFVFVEKGSSYLGSNTGDDDEKPMIIISVEEFYISKYEITNEQYTRFLNESTIDPNQVSKFLKINGKWRDIQCRIYFEDGVYKIEKAFENYPVNFISWFGANEFCKFYGYRLPNEYEWEYAAKGGKISFIDRLKKIDVNNKVIDFEDIAWYKKNSNDSVSKIGLKKPNSIGIYDMSGNLSEWCENWYSKNYFTTDNNKFPIITKKGEFKVHRGGSWANSIKTLRISNRRASIPYTQNATIGFRVVKSAD